MINSLHIHEDSGHAWAKVKKSLLIELGIADKISFYSYQFKDYAYLEEDCDLGVFLSAIFKGVIPDQWWKTIKVIRHYSKKESPIRSYQRYSPEPFKEISPGDSFTLYGKEFKALYKRENQWAVKCLSDGLVYGLKNKQLAECKIINKESEQAI